MAKIIEKILKQLTPERVKKEVEAVQKVKLPPDLQKWVDEYNKTIKVRPYFNFPWIYQAVQIIIFPATIQKYKRDLWVTKTLIFMFNILLDDIADKIQDKRLLEELLNIPFKKTSIIPYHLGQEKRQYFKFAAKLWGHIIRTIQKYPRYKEFKDLFEYDCRQYLNAMKYAYLINTNHHLINKIEMWTYLSHGMQVFPIMDVDLMCSRFNIRNLGFLREVVWHFQKMARIGNWVSTWEREIGDNDFTSGVWAYALSQGTININELKKENKSTLIKQIKNSKIEESLLKEWEENYQEIVSLSKKFTNKEIRKYVKEFLLGIEKLLFFHLISHGYK